MTPPISIDGTDVSGITIDGTEVTEVTVDGDVVYAPSAIPDSVTNRWKMDEGSGSTLADSVGSVSASTAGGATWVSDTAATGGYYLRLDGVDDEWSTDTSFGIDNQQVTVMGWLKPDEYSQFGVTVAQSDGGSSEDGWILGTEDAAELLTWEGNGTDSNSVLRSVPFVATGNWGFFALVLDGQNHRMITYDNTQELADQNVTSEYARSTGTDVLRAGNGRWGFYQTDMDDWYVAVDSTLTKSEIESVWQDTQR